VFDEMKGAMVFSKIDLRSRYHQLRIKDDDVPKTAFKMRLDFTSLLFYHWTNNRPMVILSWINGVFHEYLGKFVQVFLDDI
jgi:hypothetical protein